MKRTYFFVLFLVIFFPRYAFAQEKLIFSAFAKGSILVLKEAYKRMGVEFEVKYFPVLRSPGMIENGDIDGELLRVANLEMKYKNIIRIPVPVYYAKMIAATKSAKFVMDGYESLNGLSVGFMTGMHIVKKGLSNAKPLSVQPVRNFDTVMKLLELDRVEVIVLPETDMISRIKKLNMKNVNLLYPEIERVYLYHYLNKKHAVLADQLTKVLQNMEAEGVIEQLIQQRKNDIINQILLDVKK